MVSAFAARVYAQVRKIPVGRVVTYKTLAAALHCRSARAVGQALRCNPFAPDVPCHRVIRSDLRMGGFKGTLTGDAVAQKEALLQCEGVRFVDGRLQEPERLLDRIPNS